MALRVPRAAEPGWAPTWHDQSWRSGSRTEPGRRRPAARYRWNGSTTIRVAPPSTCAESPRSPRARPPAIRGKTRTWRSIECSSSRSLCTAGLILHHGNEQVGDAGRAHVAKRGELLAIDTIEQQDAATEHLALVHRLERPCRGGLLGVHHHFHIARLHFFHAAVEYDTAAVDEHDIGEDVLDLFHLVCRYHDGAVAIEVVVQQGIVELLAIQDVEAQRRLVQHQQFRVNRHYQREVQLGHHALRQFSDFAGASD